MNTEENPFVSHMEKQISDPNFRASQRALERIKNILQLLKAPKIDTPALEALCFNGIPDECSSLRSLCWKIFLGYLPSTTSRWEKSLADHRKNYAQYIDDFYTRLVAALKIQTEKRKIEKENWLAAIKAAEENKEGDNKSTNKNNVNAELEILHFSKREELYPGFMYDDDLWDDIVKDTKRTRSEMDFYQRETEHSRESNKDKKPEEVVEETHNDVLARMLFIYAKLNPGVRYVQGMNEIVAPIYYIFAADKSPLFINQSEPDAFFCFSLLMGEIQDAFIKNLDKTNVGIQARMLSLNNLLKEVDFAVWDKLEKFGVNPQFYTLRWLMLLLTQEFELMDVIRLWDSLLSHPKKLEYLNYLCLAMIELLRDRILESDDFADLIEMLQKQSAGDLDSILVEAARLYQAHSKSAKKV